MTNKSNSNKKGKGKNNKNITVLADGKSATNDTKETLVDNVNDAKDDTKETSIGNAKDARDNNEKAKVQDKDDDTEAPVRPSANNGAYSQHFDPIPAENKSKKNGNLQLSTVDISK